MVFEDPSVEGRGRLVTKHVSSDFRHRHYDEVSELGKGAFGRVALVRERCTGQERVCKVVSIAGMPDYLLVLARREIRLLCDLDHPRVVRLYEYAEDFVRQEIVLILEYFPGGDCTNLIKDGAKPTEALIARIMSQALVALSHCHDNGIIHRDIKLENLMLSSAPSRSRADCRLIDFGLGERLEDGVPLHAVLGTPPYMAPEVKREDQDGYSSAADVWSLGACAFELLAGECPFGRPTDYGGRIEPLFDRLLSYKELEDLGDVFVRSASWRGRSEGAKDFVRRLLCADQAERPTIAEALEHPWLQRHQSQTAASLSPELLQSLESFAGAPAIARSCLYAIAARTDAPDLKEIGQVFLGMDEDGNGQISREEFCEAIDYARNWWGPAVDKNRLFNAIDLDKTGSVSFTKFTAGCLYASFPTLEDILILAFEVLDEERRGTLSIHNLRRLLPGCDSPALQMLPQDRAFGADDWLACVLTSLRSAMTAKSPQKTSASFGFFDRLFCTGCSHDVGSAELIISTQSERRIISPYARVACA